MEVDVYILYDEDEIYSVHYQLENAMTAATHLMYPEGGECEEYVRQHEEERILSACGVNAVIWYNGLEDHKVFIKTFKMRDLY